MAKTKSKKSKALIVQHAGVKLSFGLHATGQYRKRYKGQQAYLGNNPDNVLTKWLEHVDRVDNGPQPEAAKRVERSKFTVGDLVNHLLADRKALIPSGEFTDFAYQGCENAGKSLIKFLGRGTICLQPRNQMTITTMQ